MNNKSIQSVLFFAVMFYIIISFCACTKDDNPVNPTPPTPPILDTADRYIWEVVKSGPYDMNSIYVADSNNIYIVCGWSLYFSDGKNFTYYNLNDNNFQVDVVYGYDKNNIFIIGYYFLNGKRYGELKKITNGVVSSYLFENKHGIFYDLLVTGPNQVWISELYTSKVLYFDNGSVSEYITNKTDSLSYNTFFLSPDNNLYIFGSKVSNESIFNSYKLVNNNFILNQTEYIIHFPLLFRCGKDIIRWDMGTLNLSYFYGDNWISHPICDSATPPSRLGGISKDSLVLINLGGIIYTSNGNKWRKEKNAPFLYMPDNNYFYNIETKFGNVYSTFWGQNDSYFLIGRPNKNLKNQTQKK